MRVIRYGGRGGMRIESLERRRLLAFDLLADVGGQSATESVTVDGVAYFFADDGVVGRELWRSDNTAAGTTLVKDLTPGADSTQIEAFYDLKGRAVFITVVPPEPGSGSNRTTSTLWSTDGSAQGTVELASFTTAGRIRLKQVGEELALFFFREHPSGDGMMHDALLYFTDGTPGGTRLVKEFIATEDGNDYGGSTSQMHAAGERVLFYANNYELWSSDGTPQGTINLTPTIHPPEIDPEYGADPQYEPDPRNFDIYNTWEVADKVVVPDVDDHHRLWITDGTLDGTVARAVETAGTMQNSGVVGRTFYFYVDNFHRSPRDQTLYAFDLDRDTVEPVYRPPPRGPEDQNRLGFFRAGERLLFTDREMGSGAPGETPAYNTTLWRTDGTPTGTAKLLDLPQLAHVRPTTSVGDVAYFVLISGGLVVDGPVSVFGYLGGRLINTSGARAELWRSDGTPAGTGIVRTLLHSDDQIDRQVVDYTLTAVNGKLALRTTVKSGLPTSGPGNIINTLPVTLDDTVVYDPRELTIGRQAATARVVNGVLHVRGSLNDDRIRLFRRASDPDELVVEYNGNVRGFVFSSIRRIVADLQGGDDFFEIVEGDGGVIRTRTSIMGGDGADTINTGRGRDTILGGTGPDIIRARGNGDVINAGGGRDKITAGAGEDQIAGGTSYDRITAGPGVDVLFGQSVIEYAFGRDLEGEDLDEDMLLT